MKGAMELLQRRAPASANKSGLTFLKHVHSPKKSTPLFTVPNMKKVAKLAESMGKTVTTFTVNGDGGFTLTAVNIAQLASAKHYNPWDELENDTLPTS